MQWLQKTGMEKYLQYLADNSRRKRALLTIVARGTYRSQLQKTVETATEENGNYYRRTPFSKQYWGLLGTATTELK